VRTRRQRGARREGERVQEGHGNDGHLEVRHVSGRDLGQPRRRRHSIPFRASVERRPRPDRSVRLQPANYDPAQDTFITPEHPPRTTEGGTWERGRQNLYTTRIHKSETVDYGILLSGERVLVTDAGEHVLKPGDIVVQLGSWHQWADLNYGSQMAFVMMAADLDK
jgi:hypothetical protein